MEITFGDIYQLLLRAPPGQFAAGAAILIGLGLWTTAAPSAWWATRQPWPPDNPPRWIYFAILMAPTLLFVLWVCVSTPYVVSAVKSDFAFVSQEGQNGRNQQFECLVCEDSGSRPPEEGHNEK